MGIRLLTDRAATWRDLGRGLGNVSTFIFARKGDGGAGFGSWKGLLIARYPEGLGLEQCFRVGIHGLDGVVYERVVEPGPLLGL